MTNLNYDDFKKSIGLLGKISSSRLDLVSSQFAVERDGNRPEVIKLSWRKRLFSWPWRPWVATKTIMVPNYKPAMYRVGNMLVYHPSLEARIKQGVVDWNSKSMKLPTTDAVIGTRP